MHKQQSRTYDCTTRRKKRSLLLSCFRSSSSVSFVQVLLRSVSLLLVLLTAAGLFTEEVQGFIVSSKGRRIFWNPPRGSTISRAATDTQPEAPTTTDSRSAGSKMVEVDNTNDDDGPASSSSGTPNWRILRKGDFADAAAITQERPAYSRECFDDALQLYGQFVACNDSYVAGPIQAALNWLDHAYRLYGPESVICSFNGGKDAVVILHLVRAAHANYCYRTFVLGDDGDGEEDYGTTNSEKQAGKVIVRPRVIYFEHDDEFPEVVEFLHNSVSKYDLDMIAFEKGIKFQHGLKVLVDHNVVFRDGRQRTPTPSTSAPFPLAFVLGTRQADPNAKNQDHFAPSSHYMPPFMRVNPILEWSYGHVWHFLRQFKLPYCTLYDMGYTSLGTTKDTLPCPALAVPGTDSSDNIPKFWPAYMLRDWDQERAGRVDKDKDGGKSKTPNRKSSKKTMSGSTKEGDGSKQAVSRTDSYMSGRLSMLSDVRANVTKGVPHGETVDGGAEGGGEGEADSDESCVSYSTDTVTQRTVGLLIVGNEILKGFTADTNTQAAATALREQNVLLQRVVVVSDIFDDIVQEIRRLQKEVDVIITSGGVGPTHDDITIQSVAAALDLEMTMHDEMADLLKRKMKTDTTELTEAQVKMATLPNTSKLRYLSDKPTEDWPILQCQNLFILPGVPELFAYKIGHVAKYLSCQLERSVAYKVVLSVDEHSIVPILNRVVENHPNVSFGSYPFVSHPDFKTVLTVEGKLITDGGGDDLEAEPGKPERSNSKVWKRELIDNTKRHMGTQVQLALDELLTALPDGSVLRVDNDNMLFV